MKEFIISLCIFILGTLLLSSCTISFNSNSSEEPGETKKESHQIPVFNHLIIGGNYEVTYVYSDSTYIELEGGENKLKHIAIAVNDSVLEISKDEYNNQVDLFSKDKRTIHIKGGMITDGAPVKITIYGPNINTLELAGSVTFTTDSITSTKDFSMETGGAVDVNIKRLTCPNCKIESAGSSDITAAIFGCANTTLSTAGSSDVNLSFTNCSNAEIETVGSSDITLLGTLNSLSKSVVGSGDIKTNKLKVKKIIDDNKDE